MADGDTVQVSNPQGQPGTIPLNQWEDALDAGYQLHSHIVMYDQSGKRGIVPKEQAGQARDAGYSITAPGSETQFEKERTQGPRGVWNALKGMVPEAPEGNPLNAKFWFGRAKDWGIHPTGPGTAYSELTRPLPADLPTNVLATAKPGQSSRLGRGIYRGASLVAPLVGASAESMEAASGRGDTSGVATQAAVPIATALGAPLVKAGVGRMRMGNYQSAVRNLAGKTPADLGFTQTIERSAPDVAQVAREVEFQQKGNARVGEFHDMLNKRADEIWREEHAPQITAQAQDPVNWQDVRRAAQDAISPELAANNPAGARAAQRWINSALTDTHIGTVEGADRMLRVINAEIPNLPEPFKNIGKIVRNAAQKGIRGELETALTGAGQEGVHGPNTRWGALREIADAVGDRLNVSANEPFSLWKSIIYPGLKLSHAGAFLGGGLGYELGGGDPTNTALGAGVGAATGLGTAIGHEVMNQPGARIARAMRGLGRTGLTPETATVNPSGPPALGRPSPVAGGPATPPQGGVAQPPGAPVPSALAGPSAAPMGVNAGLPTTAAHGPLFAGQPGLAAPIEMRETAPNIFESEAGEEPEHERLIRLGETSKEAPGPTKEEIEETQARQERIEAEKRADEWMKQHGETKKARAEAEEPPAEPAEEPAEEVKIKGLTAEEPKAAKEKTKPVEKEFTKDQIEEAELLIQQEIGMMASGERPGHYYSELPLGESNPAGEQSAARGVTKGGHWYGVRSMRDMLPWMKGNKWSPSQLERALRNKDSAMYQKAIRSAVQFIESEKEATAAQEEEERAAIQGEEPLEETPEGVLPGFGQAVAEQARGAAQVRGEGLQQEMGTPRSVEEAAGRMERESPLFRYTEANPQGEMYPPVGKKRRLPQ